MYVLGDSGGSITEANKQVAQQSREAVLQAKPDIDLSKHYIPGDASSKEKVDFLWGLYKSKNNKKMLDPYTLRDMPDPHPARKGMRRQISDFDRFMEKIVWTGDDTVCSIFKHMPRKGLDANGLPTFKINGVAIPFIDIVFNDFMPDCDLLDNHVRILTCGNTACCSVWHVQQLPL